MLNRVRIERCFSPLAMQPRASVHQVEATARLLVRVLALIHENELLRPRPATNARGKHRQFMQKCIVTEEFASEGTFGQAAAVSRRRSQDPRPDRARGGAGPGRVVMGWSGAPIPPLKAAQGQRVVEKGSDVASPHCGPLPRPRLPGSSHHMIEFRSKRRTASTFLRFPINANFVSRARGAGT